MRNIAHRNLNFDNIMGQPLIPVHRLSIGWICLSIACIFTAYCMFKLWFNFNKNTTETNPPTENTKISVATVGNSSPSQEQTEVSIDLPKPQSSPTSQNTSTSPITPKLMRLIWCTLLCYLIFNLYILISLFFAQ